MAMETLFGVKKPIVALLHIRALPGDPAYDEKGGLKYIVDTAAQELEDLQNGGVDAILFANEYSYPFQKKVDYVTVSAMAFVVGRLYSQLRVPYGINVVMNPLATLDLAVATGASFIRSSFTGVYAGDSGLYEPDPAAVIRRKYHLNAQGIKIFCKVNPEADSYLGSRSYKSITGSLIHRCAPDALCVSGTGAGTETDSEFLKEIVSYAGDVPVICNTGCNAGNILEKLSCCDGACVGSAFKKDGKTANTVDLERVREFMSIVKAYRDTLN